MSMHFHAFLDLKSVAVRHRHLDLEAIRLRYTLCHELQVVLASELPTMDCHDLPVDAYATPVGLTRCAKAVKPFGVHWHLVGPELEKEIGALRAAASTEKPQNLVVS